MDTSEKASSVVKNSGSPAKKKPSTSRKKGKAKASSASKAKAELAKWKSTCAEWEAKYTRLYADFDNMRRRHVREQLQWEARAHEDLIVALLPILDDLRRSQKTLIGTQIELFAEGIAIIEKKFRSIFEQKGVKEIAIKKGDVFDSDIHEAIQQMEVSDKALVGCVLEVVEAGYRMEDRVIRHAKVITGAARE